MRKLPKTAEREPESLPPPISKMLRVDELKDGEERSIEINRAERNTIAKLLELVALDDLRFTFRIHRRGEGRLAVSGTLAAAVTQTCVVSLEPVASTLEVPVEIEFWPRHLIEDRAETIDEAASHGTLDWPEPIIDGKIDSRPGHLRDACNRPRSLSQARRRELRMGRAWRLKAAPKRSLKAPLPPSSS